MKEKLTSISYIRKLNSSENFKVSKSLGQNFLIDENTVNKIVECSGVTSNDWVIEIGPGMGALTQLLIGRAYKVSSIEIDKRLYPILKKLFQCEQNFELIENDFMKMDLDEFISERLEKMENFKGEIRVVANLPYYISTPIMMKILQESRFLSSATLMLQKEVAERICAQPNSKTYGVLSIMTQILGTPAIDFIVSKHVFVPMPKVSSAVISIDLNKRSEVVGDIDIDKFTKIVKSSFAQRRKTLINSLSSSGMYTKVNIEEALQKIGLDIRIRAENLSIGNFAQLTKEL